MSAIISPSQPDFAIDLILDGRREMTLRFNLPLPAPEALHKAALQAILDQKMRRRGRSFGDDPKGFVLAAFLDLSQSWGDSWEPVLEQLKLPKLPQEGFPVEFKRRIGGVPRH